MKREAKQFAFMLAGVILGATVLFVVGMEVGRRADVSFLDEGKAGLDKAADALAKTNATASADYSFLEELDAPVEPRRLRKFKNTYKNANNSPEVEAELKKRRARVEKFKARKLARKKATGYVGPDRRDKKISVKRLTRKNVESRAGSSVADSAAPDAARGLLAKPADGRRTLARTLTPVAANLSDNGRSYTLQLGVYRSQDAAARLVDKLRAQGHQPRMTRSSVPGKGEVFRVRMGRYESIAAADRSRSKVAASGHSAMVTPL